MGERADADWDDDEGGWREVERGQLRIDLGEESGVTRDYLGGDRFVPRPAGVLDEDFRGRGRSRHGGDSNRFVV